MAKLISQIVLVAVNFVYYSLGQSVVDNFSPYQQFNGVVQQVFLRYFAFDDIVPQNPREFTAGFTVAVDDYSQLTIPNSMYTFNNC
jgi:hypothetical protein